jgi:hypothetical protein
MMRGPAYTIREEVAKLMQAGEHITNGSAYQVGEHVRFHLRYGMSLFSGYVMSGVIHSVSKPEDRKPATLGTPMYDPRSHVYSVHPLWCHGYYDKPTLPRPFPSPMTIEEGGFIPLVFQNFQIEFGEAVDMVGYHLSQIQSGLSNIKTHTYENGFRDRVSRPPEDILTEVVALLENRKPRKGDHGEAEVQVPS